MSKTASALTAATLPLGGTELMYVVQGGNSRSAPLSSVYIPGGTDVAVVDGGTGASTAAGARTALGLAIGTDVQAYDADLTAWAGVNPSSYSTTAAIAAAYQPLDSDLTSWAGVTRASGFDTFAATPSSANLRALLSDEVGTGAAYFVGGALGTPASGVMTNMTGTPASIGLANGTGLSLTTGVTGTLPIANGGTNGTTAGAARLNLVAPTYVADRTALKALDTTKDAVAVLRETNRDGLFLWSGSNLSSLVSIDTQEGLYVAPASAPTGASGAWVRQRNNLDVYVKWFGAVGDTIDITGNTSITSGAAALTVVGASFAASDVGKRIIVPGAGAAGAILVTTISGYTSATQVTLGSNAGTTLSAVSTTVTYGTDDSTPINKAILALPVTGATVWLSGAHAVSTSITAGDGTSSALSTRWGVRLEGVAPPSHVRDSSTTAAAPAAAIRYLGAATANGVLMINGPLTGFAVKNLFIDGSLLADRGLWVRSGSKGEISGLTIKNCKYSYAIECYSNSGYTPAVSANSDMIWGNNILIYMPAITGAVGMIFDGPADGTASTCFVSIDVTRIYMASTQGYGIIRKVCDAVTLKNVLIYNAVAANAGSFGVLDDYSGNALFPCGCAIDTADIGWNLPATQQWGINGSAAGAAGPNHVRSLSEVNGGSYPQIANIVTDQVLKKYSTILAADFVGSNVATAQPVFAAAQDTITLKGGRTYRFKGLYVIARGAGTTSHTTSLLWGGTATFTSFDALAKVSNADAGSIGAVSDKEITVATATVVTAANISAIESVKVLVEGVLVVNAGGTFIPQFQYSVAPGGAPSIRRGSVFEIWETGNSPAWS